MNSTEYLHSLRSFCEVRPNALELTGAASGGTQKLGCLNGSR